MSLTRQVKEESKARQESLAGDRRTIKAVIQEIDDALAKSQDERDWFLCIVKKKDLDKPVRDACRLEED